MRNRSAPNPSHHELCEPAPQGGPALRVLVIEAESDAAASLADRLGSSGFEVRVARDAPAVQAAQAHPPDVILLDLALPGLTGVPVAQWFRGGPRTAKRPLLIALSGGGRQGDQRHSAETGVDLHLEKPVDFEVVRGLLHRFQAIIH